MSDNQLAVIGGKRQEVTPSEFQHMVTIAKALSASGYFKDATGAPQAVAKMMLGREYGLGYVESLMGIHFIEAGLSLSAGVIAAAIRRSKKYDYDVIESSDRRCEISFVDVSGGGRRELGRISFTIEEADAAGLSTNSYGKRKPNWSRTPSDMLFARVITRGSRRLTPDVFDLPVYSDGDFEQDIPEAPESVVNQFTPHNETTYMVPNPESVPLFAREEIPEGEIETQDAPATPAPEDLSPLIYDYETLRAECNEKGVKSPKGAQWPALADGAPEQAIRKAIGMARVALEEFEQQSQAFDDSGDAFDDEPEVVSPEQTWEGSALIQEEREENAAPEPETKQSKRAAFELKFYEACAEHNLNVTSPAMMPAINAHLKKQGAAEIESFKDAPTGVIYVITNHIENSELNWE